MGYSRGSKRIKRKVGVLLDTNMLVLIADGINILDQIEERLAIRPRYIVLTPVLEELRRIASNSRPSVARKARFVLEFVKKYCDIVDIDINEYRDVDELLIKYALRHGYAVATNDKELRRRLRENGIPEIYIREESMRIDIEGLEV